MVCRPGEGFPDERTAVKMLSSRKRPLLVRGVTASMLVALTLASAPAASAVDFDSTGSPISIPSSGKATPYPSSIAVSGLPATADLRSVTLRGVNHTYLADVDVLLVSPSGQSVILMSDVGCSNDAVNATYRFQDGSPQMTSPASGTYSPTNTSVGGCFSVTDAFPAPAPGGAPSGTDLATFDAGNPNGTWSLYVTDDTSGDAGSIGSWTLDFPVPAFSVSPTSASFTATPVGESSASQTLTVTNTGSATLAITSATLAGNDAAHFSKGSDACTGANLAPNATCSVSVSFAPTTTGAKTAMLRFVDNAFGSPHDVALSGTGTAPVFAVAPSRGDFSSQRVGSSSAPQTFTVTNTGDAPLTITNASVIGSPSGQFTEVSDDCTGHTVAPSATCTVTLTFTPTRIGTHEAVLRFTSNAATSPDDVPLRGTGRAVPGADTDSDGVVDTADNCPTVQNPNQADNDGDGIGNVCEDNPPTDTDHDLVYTPDDNCPTVPNPGQADTDRDGIGDACDTGQAGAGKQRINPSIKGKNTARGDDKIVVRARAADGAHVKLYKTTDRNHRVLVDEGTLNANGVWKTTINDTNGPHLTAYKAIVSPTADTRRGATNRLQQQRSATR
jgi:subtilisin-like proprotein convertase family protein